MIALKKLIPSLLIVGLYVLADEFFGKEIGLGCIAVLGFGEFIYVRGIEKRYDWTILFVTLAIWVPGILENRIPALEKFQSGIAETAFCILLGYFAYSGKDMSATLPASYRKTICLTSAQQTEMRKTVRILFYGLCFHTLGVFYASLYLSPGTASFISGPLLYTAIGLLFLILIVRKHLLILKYKREEWLPVVNETGEIIGKSPRSLCHAGSRLLHPVVHLHLLNNRSEIFLQKRSMKKEFLPGKWDTAVGGHVGWNEKVEEALKRESREELGLTDFKASFIASYIWESEREKELVFVFISNHHTPVHIQPEEVDEGKFWTLPEIETGIVHHHLTPNFVQEYRNFLLPYLHSFQRDVLTGPSGTVL